MTVAPWRLMKSSPNTTVERLQVECYRVERVTRGKWQPVPGARKLTGPASKTYLMAARAAGYMARIVTDDEHATVIVGPKEDV